MWRRQFLQGIGGLATLGLGSPALARRPRLRVGIVGSGIVGASIAMHLAEGGADVVLFEKTAPASGATRNSFAWLKAFVADEQYRALRLRSLAAYRALDAPLALGIIWGGYLTWAGDSAEAQVVSANAAQLAGTRFPARMLTAAELWELDPAIDPGPVAAALYSAIDGHLDPVRATGCFLARAHTHGARTVYPCAVEGLQFHAGRLTAALTSNGTVPLERLVVAAGVGAPQLLAMAGFELRLRHAPGFLAHSRALGPLTTRICDAPGGLEFKQMANGSLVGTDFPEPPDLPVHAAIRASRVDFPDEVVRAPWRARARQDCRLRARGTIGGARSRDARLPADADRLAAGGRGRPRRQRRVRGGDAQRRDTCADPWGVRASGAAARGTGRRACPVPARPTRGTRDPDRLVQRRWRTAQASRVIGTTPGRVRLPAQIGIWVVDSTCLRTMKDRICRTPGRCSSCSACSLLKLSLSRVRTSMK